MPSIYDWKPAFQARLRPLADRLAAEGVTANQVTVGAVALAWVQALLLLGWPAAWFPLLLLPVAIAARLALNAIDGLLAREHGQATKLGAVLNEAGDVLADGLLYLPLMAVPGAPTILIGLAVLMGLAAEMAGVAVQTLGASRRNDGPMGKSDRGVVFAVVGLLLGLGLDPGWWLDLVMLAVTVLAALTIRNRIVEGLAEAGE